VFTTAARALEEEKIQRKGAKTQGRQIEPIAFLRRSAFALKSRVMRLVNIYGARG
jgi:hypothetical protein